MTSASCSSSSLPVPSDQWLCVPQSPGILYHPRRLCHKRFVHTEWPPGARGIGERERRVSSFKRQRSASTSRRGGECLVCRPARFFLPGPFEDFSCSDGGGGFRDDEPSSRYGTIELWRGRRASGWMTNPKLLHMSRNFRPSQRRPLLVKSFP